MRYPQELTAGRHEKILYEASRLFREHGLDGVGVAEIMKAAHLTHGGFYAHFDSKEHLAAEASVRAMAEMHQQIERAAASGRNAATNFMAEYLSPTHRDHPGSGCGIAALAPDIARQSGKVRSAFTAELRRIIGAMTQKFHFRSGQNAQTESIRLLASLVGAMVLARAVNDESFSREILDAVKTKVPG